MRADEIMRWATPVAVLAAGLVVAAALWLKPTPTFQEQVSPVAVEDVRAVRQDLAAVREDLAKAREEAGRSRCELHRLNEQIQQPDTRGFLMPDGC